MHSHNCKADVRRAIKIVRYCRTRQYRTIFIACVTLKVVQLCIVQQKLSDIEHVQFFSYDIAEMLWCDWSDTCCL